MLVYTSKLTTDSVVTIVTVNAACDCSVARACDNTSTDS